MCERYLMTQSLLSSWTYALADGGEESFTGFLSTLKREPQEPTPAMQNGIRFENMVYAFANHAVPADFNGAWADAAMRVAGIIEGAPVRVKAQTEIDMDGIPILLYGILDALKAGTIYDVKFLNSSFGSADLPGEYLASVQHPAYFRLVPEAERFVYIVSDGRDIYTEEYRRADCEPIENTIRTFLQFLHATNLQRYYFERWRARV